MRASTFVLTGLAVAFVSLTAASAQKSASDKTPVKHETPGVRQAKAQPALQMYCYNNVPCRPVKTGCHLEHIGQGGFNEEICN